MTYIVAELWIFLDCYLEPEHDFLLLYILSKQYLVIFFTLFDRSLYYSSIFLLFIYLEKSLTYSTCYKFSWGYDSNQLKPSCSTHVKIFKVLLFYKYIMTSKYSYYRSMRKKMFKYCTQNFFSDFLFISCVKSL